MTTGWPSGSWTWRRPMWNCSPGRALPISAGLAWLAPVLARTGAAVPPGSPPVRSRPGNSRPASAPGGQADLGGVIEPAEEERRVRQVVQGLGTPVQVGLQVLLGDTVAGQRAKREHVLAHQPQVLPG